MRRNENQHKQQHRQRHADGKKTHGPAAAVFAAQNMIQPGKQIHRDKTQQQNGDNPQHAPILPQTRPKRKFRPPLPLTAAALLLAAAAARLAVWQFDRAEQNAAHTALAAPPQPLNRATLRPFARASAAGNYRPEFQIYIDNRVRNKTAGVHIITPLLLENGNAVAVNRGWMHKNARPPPTPEGKITVRGVLQKDQSGAFTLSDNTEDGNLWQNLDLQKYAEFSGLPLITLVLFDENAAAPATVRTDFKSANSKIYAWQWTSLGILTLVFYVVLGFRKP